jgi:hypothetical protein
VSGIKNATVVEEDECYRISSRLAHEVPRQAL